MRVCVCTYVCVSVLGGDFVRDGGKKSETKLPTLRDKIKIQIVSENVFFYLDNTKQRSNFRGRTLSQANKSTDTTVIMIMKKMKSLCFLL